MSGGTLFRDRALKAPLAQLTDAVVVVVEATTPATHVRVQQGPIDVEGWVNAKAIVELTGGGIVGGVLAPPPGRPIAVSQGRTLRVYAAPEPSELPIFEFAGGTVVYADNNPSGGEWTTVKSHGVSGGGGGGALLVRTGDLASGGTSSR